MGRPRPSGRRRGGGMSQRDDVDELDRCPDRSPDGDSAGHVLVVVENIPLCVDQRVRKQVPRLLDAGYHVSVVTRQHPDHAAWREMPQLTVLEHPAPAEPERALGYVREYAAAFGWAAALAVVAHRRRPVTVVQLCQPPDVYFPVAWLLRALGAAVV